MQCGFHGKAEHGPVKAAVEKLAGTLESFDFALGDHDVVAIGVMASILVRFLVREARVTGWRWFCDFCERQWSWL